MKAFLSWSGELSKAIADVFYGWLPSVLQNVKPYMSAEDINKGEKWMNNISNNLGDTSIGLIFVTKENVDSPWINYETGALSNSLNAANVCPVLIDLQKGEIDSRYPLFHYQATALNDKDDILKLLKTINNQQGELRISDEALKKVFEWAWPTLKYEIDNVQKTFATQKKQPVPKEKTEDSSSMDEILALLRSMKKEQQMNFESESRYKRLMVQNRKLLEENETLNHKVNELIYENAILNAKNEVIPRENSLLDALTAQQIIAERAKMQNKI